MRRYNHRTNPYSGFGVYEGIGADTPQCPPGSHAVVDPFGSGMFVCMSDAPGVPAAAPPPTGCPSGQIGFPALGIPCTPMPGQPQSVPPMSAPQCPDGQIGWPSLGLPCMSVPNAVPAGPTPAPQATNPCPAGQFGWPPFVPCMSLPAAPSAPPVGGCPPGTFGLPPNCLPLPQAAPPVVPSPVAPPSAPVTPPPTTPWMTYGLIGAGILAVVVLMKPKRAVANRRRR